MMLEELKRAWYEKVLRHGLADERVIIHTRPLKPEEVIGKPIRDAPKLVQEALCCDA